MSKIISSLSKIWLKVKNLENSLFPELQASLKEHYNQRSMVERVKKVATVLAFGILSICIHQSKLIFYFYSSIFCMHRTATPLPLSIFSSFICLLVKDNIFA